MTPTSIFTLTDPVKQVAELIECLRLATNELNAVRARDGSPVHLDWTQDGRPLVTHNPTEEWWEELTERCFAALEAVGVPNART